MLGRAAALFWLALMVVWLAALAFGVWWVWPHFERVQLTTDLIGSLIWLTTGAVAWLVMLRYGLRRYWNR